MAINFHIKTKDLDLTPEITSQVHEKLGVIEKFLAPSGDQKVLAEIEIGLRSKHHQKGDVYRAEANVTCDGDMFRASTNASSISAALDELKDEIGKTIRRKKGKGFDLRRSGARLIKNILRRK